MAIGKYYKSELPLTSRESMVQHLTGYHYLGSQLGMRARVSESLLWAFPCGLGFFTAW